MKVGHEDKIVVFFNGSEKVKTNDVVLYVKECEKQKINHAIIVTQNQLTNLAQQAIFDISENFQLESFEEKELLINVTKHELVPQHDVLSDAEKKELLNRYKIEDKQLPRILMTLSVDSKA